MYKERRRRSRRAAASTSVGGSGRWNGGEGSFLNGKVVLEVGEEDGGPKNVFLRVVVQFLAILRLFSVQNIENNLVFFEL